MVLDEPCETEIRFFPIAPMELVGLDTGDRIKLNLVKEGNEVSFLRNGSYWFEKAKGK